MGFGVCTVSGRSLVPLPPTRRIASVTCRLCFLPGPAELSFGRPVYADRLVGFFGCRAVSAPGSRLSPDGGECAPPNTLRPSAPLIAGRVRTGRAEFAVELLSWALRG